jgi:hypothetical protein
LLDALGKSMRQIRSAIGATAIDPKLLTRQGCSMKSTFCLRHRYHRRAIRERFLPSAGSSRRVLKDYTLIPGHTNPPYLKPYGRRVALTRPAWRGDGFAIR